MDPGLDNPMHAYLQHLEIRVAYEDLQHRYVELEERYLSMCRAARATAMAWLDLLDREEDPLLAIVPDAYGAAAS